jgi:hypothetical protein
MKAWERWLVYPALIILAVVSIIGYTKLTKMRVWATAVVAFTDHLQAKHSAPVDPPGPDHIPPPPPPPDW